MINSDQNRPVGRPRYRIPARPANAGAHRLGAWLFAGADTNDRALAIAAFASRGTVERMLSGCVVPVEDLACAIAATTRGAVRPDDWDERTALGWGDAPVPHERVSA